MKNRLLKAIYLRYKSYFYRFFCDEFFDEIPTSVVEPSMKFLSEGKDRLEKWGLWQARLLQSRMVDDPDKIKTYEGMMLMVKLLLLHTEAPTKRPTAPIGGGEPKRDDIKEAAEAVKELKKLSTPKPIAP